MKKVVPAVVGIVLAWSVSIAAQWPQYSAPGARLPLDAKGNVNLDAPPPRTADGHVDLSGTWSRAESGPPRAARAGGGGAAPAGAPPA